MSEDDRPQSAPHRTPEPPIPDPVTSHRLLSRRTFVGGALSSTLPFFALSRGVRPGGRVTSHQSYAATPVPGASPVAASPAAGTPMAVPNAMPTARLAIIDDQRPDYPGTPVRGGELRLPLGAGSNENFNPAAFRQDFQIMASYLDPLVWIDEVTMEPAPWLAESWSWSQDGTRITYKLRDGVRWHDRERFSAKDVVFSFYVYRDDVDSAVTNLFSNMASAEAEDDLTVVVNLSQPDGNWLLNASSQLILQREQYIRHWNSNAVGRRTLDGFDWNRSPALGTGPWRIENHSDTETTFSRFGAYWAGAPHFDTLTLSVIDSPEQQIRAWRADETDVVWPLSPSALSTMMDTPGTVYVADTASVMFAAFNFDNPGRANPGLLENLDLRRAMSLAIDRQRYADDVFGGFAYPERAGTIAQPWANDPETTNPARDVQAARDLLATAGFVDLNGDGVLDGIGDTLRFSLIVDDRARPELLRVVESIVSDLAEVGIALEVRRLDPSSFATESLETHTYDLIAYAYNLYPGFTDFDLYGSAWDIRQNSQGWNPGGYANATVDRTVREILVATDPEKQHEGLTTLQRTTNEDLFALWFGSPRDLILVQPDIQGFQPNKQWQTWDTRKLWRN